MTYWQHTSLFSCVVLIEDNSILETREKNVKIHRIFIGMEHANKEQLRAVPVLQRGGSTQ